MSQYSRYPSFRVPTYASAASFPALGNTNGDLAVALDTSTLYEWNGTAWVAIGTPGAAIALDGLIGDVSATGPGIAVATLATVNSNVGSFGSASNSVVFTVNGKGLITAASSTAIQIAESQVTNLVSDLAGKQPLLTIGNLTDAGTDGITITGGTGAVIGSGASLSQHVSDATHNGYLSSSDWSTFNNKLDKSSANYITNPDFEVGTTGWNLYNNSGNPAVGSVVAQDITYTAVSGPGNGINIDYIFHPTQSYTTPLVTVVSPTHITVAWYNGPTVANNPTATQLKAAYDAVPGAVAIATSAITGTASRLQYETGSNITSGGGDTAPTTGTGGAPSGVTFTRNTSSPLVGVASGDLGKTALSEQGQGVSTDFTINAIDKNQTLQISFAYSGSTNMVLGASSDVKVFVYDIGNAVLIPVTPAATISGPVNTAKTFVGTFKASSSSNYRLILHIATTNALAWDLLIDAVTVNDIISPSVAQQVPSLVLLAQPVSGSVTDHMCVMWRDGATQWVPATIAGAAIPAFGDDVTQLGFATNIVGSTASIYIRGAMDGFSFGPFTGYEQYIDNTAGLISPLPSPFTDLYVTVGMAISSTVLNIQFNPHVDLISNGSGVPIKGGLLTSSAVNDGTGDVVLSPGANGTFLVANSAAAKGLNYRTLASADIPNNAANTTGSAATLTTARTIAGTSFNGSANIALANKFIVQGTADAGLSGAQFLGALATGLVKNTTTTGVLSIAAASDVTGQLLTGYTLAIGGGTVAATDSILQGIQKLVGQPQVKTGTNGKIGTAVLAAGTVTVANTSVTANSRIFLTSNVDGGTPGWLRVSAKTVGTSFVITSSSNTDTSTVAWMIVESIP